MDLKQICLQKNLVLRASTPCFQWRVTFRQALVWPRCLTPPSSQIPFTVLLQLISGFIQSLRSWVCALCLPGVQNSELGAYMTRTTTLIWTQPQTTNSNNHKIYWAQDWSFKQHKQEILQELSTVSLEADCSFCSWGRCSDSVTLPKTEE